MTWAAAHRFGIGPAGSGCLLLLLGRTVSRWADFPGYFYRARTFPCIPVGTSVLVSILLSWPSIYSPAFADRGDRDRGDGFLFECTACRLDVWWSIGAQSGGVTEPAWAGFPEAAATCGCGESASSSAR